MKKVFIFIILLVCFVPTKAQSFSEIKRLAENGDKVAQYNLGLCYYSGGGVAQDYTQAIYWFSKAAEQRY